MKDLVDLVFLCLVAAAAYSLGHAHAYRDAARAWREVSAEIAAARFRELAKHRGGKEQ